MSKKKQNPVEVKLAEISTIVEAHNKLLTTLNNLLNDPRDGVVSRLTRIEEKLNLSWKVFVVVVPVATAVIIYILEKLPL